MKPERYYVDRWAAALLEQLTDEQKAELMTLPPIWDVAPLSLIREAKSIINHLDSGWLRYHVATDIAEKVWEVLLEQRKEEKHDTGPG